MKLVALTQRLVELSETHEVRDTLDIRWAALCRKLNVLPVVLPTDSDVSKIFKTLPIEGIILTGGNDLSSVSPNKLSRRRDHFERQVLDLGLKQKIPVLGVCRGLQFIAERFGVRCEKVEGHVGSHHGLQVSEKSLFKSQLSKLRSVNSYHNYGIKKAPAGFLAAAMSPDGVIEALEQPKMKIFAQMWHPEREKPFLQAQLSLLKKFFRI